MNASRRAAALRASFETQFSSVERPAKALAGLRPCTAHRSQTGRGRSRLIAIGATVALQAGLVFTAFHGLGTPKVTSAPAPLMLVDLVQETKVLPPPPAPSVPLMAPPGVVAMELPEVHAAPAPDAITVASPTAVPQTAAPTNGVPSDGKAAVATYQSLLLGHLARHKQYPATARARRQQGVAYVRFSMDRQGRVISVALAKSAGAALLDGESLDLLRRASPLPAPPVEVAGDPVDLIVPVEFFIR